mgnify:CR=1 FL=1
MTRACPVALSILLAGMVSTAHAACEYPSEVQIPDGKSATQAEISAASAAVKKYLADMEAYTACLDSEAAALPADLKTPEAKALHIKRYNAAVDAMEGAASRFNEELRAFKAASK